MVGAVNGFSRSQAREVGQGSARRSEISLQPIHAASSSAVARTRRVMYVTRRNYLGGASRL